MLGVRGSAPQDHYHEQDLSVPDSHVAQTSQAKRLISQYESLSTPSNGGYALNSDPDAGAAPYDLSAMNMSREKSTKKMQYVSDNPGPGETGKKAPSPIRQSLRNLFAVIKKKGALGKKKDAPETDYGGNGIGTLQRRKKRNGRQEEVDETPPLPNLDLRPNASTTIGVDPKPHISELLKKKTVGTLLYLAPSDSKPNQTRIWQAYVATLDPMSHMLHLASSKVTLIKIPLVGCTDVRSLDVSKLSRLEAEALQRTPYQEIDKVKFFEIRYKDESTEKFAAVGAKERAGWISAIWDSILPGNKASPTWYDSFLATSHSQSASGSLQHAKPIESPVPISLPRMSLLLNNDLDSGEHSKNTDRDRDLPPLPAASPLTSTKDLKRNYLNLHLEIPPRESTFSPSIYPTSSCSGGPQDVTSGPQPPFLGTSSPSSTTVIRPFSSSYFSSKSGTTSPYSYNPPSASVLIAALRENPTGASNTTTPTQSPSIMHLSHLSVVRQRLAQIERSHSEVSAKSATSSSGTLGTNARNGITTSGGLAALGSLVEPIGGGAMTTGRPKLPLRQAEDMDRTSRPVPGLNLSKFSNSLDNASGTEVSDTPKQTNKGRILLEKNRTLSPPPLLTLEPTRRRSHARSGSNDGSYFPAPASSGRETPKKPRLTKEDIENMLSKRIDAVKSVLGEGQPGEPTIHEVVQGLEHKTKDNGEVLAVIRERVKDIGVRLGDLTAATAVALDIRSRCAENEVPVHHPADISGTIAEVSREAQRAVLHAIEDVKDKLTTNFPDLVDEVKEVRSLQNKLLEQVTSLKEMSEDKGTDTSTAFKNIAASESPHGQGRDTEVVDLKQILDKLDGLKTLLEAFRKVDEEKKMGHQDEEGSKEEVSEQLQKILSHVQEESSQQTIFSHQLADSVRYLNELNNWLETFVTNGTSQIQGLSTNIQHLSDALGCTTDTQSQQTPGAVGQVRAALVPGGSRITPNLLGDIRQLVVGMQARDQNFAALQSAVHSLLEVLSSSQTQMGAESQAIAGLITRQRQEQEALLRTFTSEISGEIKGERLRFVEAMKEATAINVQFHVEHFKQDLSREVMAMTEEVGRLHREKQIIENQISDLFAFYSKHKQVAPDQTNVEDGYSRRRQERAQLASIPRSSHHRPLPQPHRH